MINKIHKAIKRKIGAGTAESIATDARDLVQTFNAGAERILGYAVAAVGS